MVEARECGQVWWAAMEHTKQKHGRLAGQLDASRYMQARLCDELLCLACDINTGREPRPGADSCRLTRGWPRCLQCKGRERAEGQPGRRQATWHQSGQLCTAPTCAGALLLLTCR